MSFVKTLKEYDAKSILTEDVFEEIFAEEDLISRSYMIRFIPPGKRTECERAV